MLYRPSEEDARMEGVLLKVLAALTLAPVLAVHIYQMVIHGF